MIIKVCGLTDDLNYKEIVDTGATMLGLNFYAISKRFIGSRQITKVKNETRVGVYVNHTLTFLKESADTHQLDYLQLHGDEDVDYCKAAQLIRPIIKVWRIGVNFKWSLLEEFSFADYFLFDTKVPAYGGSGHKFDWSVLNSYTGETPFLLAGGISAEDVESIKQIEHPQFAGVDINSRFEISPGIKNQKTVADFIAKINQ